MDLRPYIKNTRQFNQAIELIKANTLCYQPFILHDDLEVGEGQNLVDRYINVESVFDLNVYARDIDLGGRKLVTDKDYFRKCNAEYRELYDFIKNTIYDFNNKDLSDLSFAEIGCNSGLNLFNLAKMGAKHCVGYDWNNMGPTFNWLNEILGTNVEFVQGTWDNLLHNFTTKDIPEVDIMINTVFTNHQCDPLQFLAYICDRAKKGVFLMVLMDGSEEGAVLSYSAERNDILENDSKFPLNFNNCVAISKNLLECSLKKLGFGEITEAYPSVSNLKWSFFTRGFRTFYATRTADVKSAYWKEG